MGETTTLVAPRRPMALADIAPWAIPLTAFLLFAAISLNLLLTTSFPAPDELQHISYAAALQEAGIWLPHFESQTTLSQTDFQTWDPRPNYLGHPSPYYIYVGWFLDRTLPPALAMLAPRLASLALLLLGMALALQAGMRCFNHHLPALLTFSALLALCPELLTDSQQVTNDSLAVLGGCLAYAGACATTRRAPFLLGAGLMLALWAKPNSGIEIGILTATIILLRPGSRRPLLIGTTIGGLLGIIPAALIFARYHAIVPLTVESFVNLGIQHSLADYTPVFLANVGKTWGFRTYGAWPIATAQQWLTSLLFWLMMLCTAPGIRLASRHLPRPSAAVAIAAPIAFLAVLPIHLWFSAYSLGFSMPAASFRYDLALMPALAHTLAFTVMSAPVKTRVTVSAIAGSALASGWLL